MTHKTAAPAAGTQRALIAQPLPFRPIGDLVAEVEANERASGRSTATRPPTPALASSARCSS